MLPADLDKVLSEWDVEARGGMKKPHVVSPDLFSFFSPLFRVLSSTTI